MGTLWSHSNFIFKFLVVMIIVNFDGDDDCIFLVVILIAFFGGDDYCIFWW